MPLVHVTEIYEKKFTRKQTGRRDHPYDYGKKSRVASGIIRRP